jgi:hypothetical protein
MRSWRLRRSSECWSAREYFPLPRHPEAAKPRRGEARRRISKWQNPAIWRFFAATSIHHRGTARRSRNQNLGPTESRCSRVLSKLRIATGSQPIPVAQCADSRPFSPAAAGEKVPKADEGALRHQPESSRAAKKLLVSRTEDTKDTGHRTQDTGHRGGPERPFFILNSQFFIRNSIHRGWCGGLNEEFRMTNSE